MDGNKRNFFNQRPTVQFKRKGSSINKGKWNNSSREQFSGNSQSLDTVYRILCPSKKIGGVIGKGGGIIKALREETRSKITVADSVPGSDERVIIIYSSPTKVSRKQNSDEDSNKADEQEPMEPHCAAQDALLKVNDRIVEEDLYSGVTFDDDNENIVVTRLLVPNNLVGCLLGKRGDVIQRLRSETCANIRVLPADQLPTCAMDTDELVQVVFLFIFCFLAQFSTFENHQKNWHNIVGSHLLNKLIKQRIILYVVICSLNVFFILWCLFPVFTLTSYISG